MPQPVTFGLIYDFRNPEPWQRPWVDRYAQVLEQIRWVDAALPIGGVYVTEHHFYEDGYVPSPMMLSAAIASQTRRVAVGTNLIQLPLHHPVRIAEDALVGDILSGGRFRLGIGAGYYWQEFQGVGAVLGERPSRMIEGVGILRAAFRGEPFSYSGRRFQIPEILVSPPPIRPGGPEIWMGGFVPAAIERVAQLADGFLAFGDAGIEEWFAACERAGRPAEERQLNRTYWTIVDEDPERAYAAAGPHFLHMFNDYIRREGYPGLTVFDDPGPARDIGLEGGYLLLGDAAHAITMINRDIAAGARDINLLVFMPGEDVDEVNGRLQYLSDHVIPRVDAIALPGHRLSV